MGKDKVENFNKISEARLNKTKQLLKQISNLSNSSYYEYNEEDVIRIVREIENELNNTKDILLNSRALKRKVPECEYKRFLENYINNHEEKEDLRIADSLGEVFSSINWRVKQNKSMHNTYELIEFAYTHCDGLDIDKHHSYYAYKRLNALDEILNCVYKEDGSDLMKCVKDGINTMNRIMGMSIEEFVEDKQNVLDVYKIILDCFEVVKNMDYVYRLLFGLAETQIWKKTEGMDREYYSILEKTVSSWE